MWGGGNARTWPWTARLRSSRALIEGRNVAYRICWAEGKRRRCRDGGRVRRLKVDVILTAGGVLAAVKADNFGDPYVFATATDPVGAGFAASLAKHGRQPDRLVLQTTDHAAKRVELLRELMPAARRLAILVNSNNPRRCSGDARGRDGDPHVRARAQPA